MKVFILSTDHTSMAEVWGVVTRAGHTARYANYETRVAYLSSQQLTETADGLIRQVQNTDALIYLSERNGPAVNRGMAFFAGIAYARDIPVIVVGPYDDVALYAKRIHTSTVADLDDTLARIEKLHAKSPLYLSATLDLTAYQPQKGDSHASRNVPNLDLDRATPEGAAGGSAGGDAVGDGSHI